eukprot:g4269.t2
MRREEDRQIIATQNAEYEEMVQESLRQDELRRIEEAEKAEREQQAAMEQAKRQEEEAAQAREQEEALKLRREAFELAHPEPQAGEPQAMMRFRAPSGATLQRCFGELERVAVLFEFDLVPRDEPERLRVPEPQGCRAVSFRHIVSGRGNLSAAQHASPRAAFLAELAQQARAAALAQLEQRSIQEGEPSSVDLNGGPAEVRGAHLGADTVEENAEGTPRIRSEQLDEGDEASFDAIERRIEAERLACLQLLERQHQELMEQMQREEEERRKEEACLKEQLWMHTEERCRRRLTGVDVSRVLFRRAPGTETRIKKDENGGQAKPSRSRGRAANEGRCRACTRSSRAWATGARRSMVDSRAEEYVVSVDVQPTRPEQA